jgi:hypothetical protein
VAPVNDWCPNAPSRSCSPVRTLERPLLGRRRWAAKHWPPVTGRRSLGPTRSLWQPFIQRRYRPGTPPLRAVPRRVASPGARSRPGAGNQGQRLTPDARTRSIVPPSRLIAALGESSASILHPVQRRRETGRRLRALPVNTGRVANPTTRARRVHDLPVGEGSRPVQRPRISRAEAPGWDRAAPPATPAAPRTPHRSGSIRRAPAPRSSG